MKEVKKCAKIILIVGSLIITTVNIVIGFSKGMVLNLLELSDLIPFFIALYETSDALYTLCNKIRAWFKCKTVSFQSGFTIFNDEDRDYRKINECISNGIIAAKLQYDNGSIREVTGGSTQITLKTKNNLKIALTVNTLDNEQYQNTITLSLKFQVSSRTLKDSWEIFKSFKDGFMTKTYTDKQRYDLDIDMKESGFNPFYRLTLKSVDSSDIEKVNLKFREKDTQINIYKNRIAASSPNCGDLDKILQKYIPLTNVY